MKNIQIDSMVLNLRFPSLNERIETISHKKNSKSKIKMLKVMSVATIALFIAAYSLTPSYGNECEVERGIISR